MELSSRWLAHRSERNYQHSSTPTQPPSKPIGDRTGFEDRPKEYSSALFICVVIMYRQRAWQFYINVYIHTPIHALVNLITRVTFAQRRICLNSICLCIILHKEIICFKFATEYNINSSSVLQQNSVVLWK
jgi:hypothetical protein